MKILIIKNKGVNEKFVEKQIESLSYFSKLEKLFGIDNIPFTLSELETDIDIKVAKKGKSSDGSYGYTLKELPEIPLGYDFVLFCYDGVPIFRGGGNYAYTRPKPINGAFVAEIPDSSNNNVFTHELIHLFALKLQSLGYPAKEYMDSTKVDGKWIPYYKNNTPEAKLGNYHVSLLALQPYLKHLSVKPAISTAIWALIQKFLAINKAKPKYKNFSELEVKGLDHEFVLLLDKAREFTKELTNKIFNHNKGIPFIINSGFRTPEHNKRVGGISNSSHLSGLAVDLRASNNEEQWLIVRSLMQFDCLRITVYTKSNHIHCDMDLSKNYPRLTVLNK